VAPAVAEVVLVEEPFADAQTEIGKVDLMWIVPEPETARVGDAVFTAVDDEAVQVLVAPAEGELEGGVQVGDRVSLWTWRRRQISGLTPRSTTRSR
jgi:hypothetical protein